MLIEIFESIRDFFLGLFIVTGLMCYAVYCMLTGKDFDM
jgi:hypothetical protein